MRPNAQQEQDASIALAEAAHELQRAAAAKKCWSCACLHNSLAVIQRALPGPDQPPELKAAIGQAVERLGPVQYDCLGCEECFPPLAMNALIKAGVHQLLDLPTCPGDKVEARHGWPPFPGAFFALRYQAGVAVCTLNDDQLAATIAKKSEAHLAIVGTLRTENLGIERLILNVVANPHIRFLIVCGPDSKQAVGHLPGQSLLALSRNGQDQASRIIGARGKRPVLKNLSHDAVEHFRATVQVVDFIGNADLSAILDAAQGCAARYPGPGMPLCPQRVIQPVHGYLPDRMIPDPAGYFVVYADRRRGLISLEHYQNDGLLDRLIEGANAAEVYFPAIDQELVSRLDHAAYLGRELARAEQSLLAGEPYAQDAAPERFSLPAIPCACGQEGG